MIKKVLEEREQTHGDFDKVSATAQDIKFAVRSGVNYEYLPHVHQESLDMIASKMARILSGDPNHEDHWVDIIGYAQLAIDNFRPPKKKK